MPGLMMEIWWGTRDKRCTDGVSTLGDIGEEDDATMQEKIPEGDIAEDDTTIHDGRMMKRDSNMRGRFALDDKEKDYTTIKEEIRDEGSAHADVAEEKGWIRIILISMVMRGIGKVIKMIPKKEQIINPVLVNMEK